MAPAPPARDFAKRPKAKVGKRAPAKLNATDTSFKTASVAVRSQDRSLDKNKAKDKDATSTELASSRGNALSTLQINLRHHAPAVRASGLKGIRDAVQSLPPSESSALEANLPSLLPNTCRCWLDEHGDVRSLAIGLFGDILKNLSQSSKHADLKCMTPFVQLLCAYASSALNGLDRSVRKDGALIVGLLADSDPSPSSSSLGISKDNKSCNSAMAVEVGKHADLFIPPLQSLLSSMSFGRNSSSKEGGAKRRKRDGKNATQQKIETPIASSDSTLLSLALLLRSSLSSEGNGLSSEIYSSSGRRRLDPSLHVPGDCTFLSGGSANANSMVLFRQVGRKDIGSRHRIRNIFDLPAMPSDGTDDCTEESHAEGDGFELPRQPGNDSTKVENIQRMVSLMETLRMKFVELTHCGRKTTNGLIMTTADLDTIDVLVKAIGFANARCQSYQTKEDLRLAQEQSDRNRVCAAKRQSKKRGKRSAAEMQDIRGCLAAYQYTSSKTLSLLIESFPICPMDGVPSSRFELTNAGMCSALAELGCDDMFENKRDSASGWVDPVFSYIIPRLDSIREIKGATSEKINDDTDSFATNILLKVVSELLLPHSLDRTAYGDMTYTYHLSDHSKRHELLKTFAGAFFPSAFQSEDKAGSAVYSPSSSSAAEDQVTKQLASTPMGTTAAILLATLITQSAGHLLLPPDSDRDNLFEKDFLLLLQMASVIPIYLTAWEGRLPIETGKVIAALISIARQWSESSDEVSGDPAALVKRSLNYLCLGLRCSSEALYLNKKRKPSIFERLPEQVQKLCVGLIGLLKSPAGTLAKSLSSICSKSFSQQNLSKDLDLVISKSMANYILEVMHSLRRTIPMPTYLTFLIEACGPGCLNGDAATLSSIEHVFSLDRSIGQLSRFLTSSCDQASTKVLPMISPILQKWLSPPPSSDTNMIKQIIFTRAATSIFAAFTWDEIITQNSDVLPPRFLALDERLDELLVTCIFGQLELSARYFSIEGGRALMDDRTMQQQYLAKLLGPVFLLLRYRNGMLHQFLESLSLELVNQKETKQDGDSALSGSDSNAPISKNTAFAELLMKALLLLLKSKDPVSMADLIRSSNELQIKLLSIAEDIEKCVSKGHLAHLGSKLLHQAKLLQCNPKR
ncbi:hypothetical protein ACHAWF_018248 [Thalassiosira exigua]